MGMVIIEILMFSAVTPCSLVSCYHIFGGTDCLKWRQNVPSDAVSHR